MNIILRMLMILVAALMVSGGTYALSSVATNLGGPPRGQFERRPSATTDGAATGQAIPQFDSQDRREQPRGGERRGGGLLGLLEVGAKFVVIALIVAVFLVLSRVTQSLQARLADRKETCPPPSTF